MSKRYTGRCACGSVTYGFDEPPTFVANCHCTDCKRASGEKMATFGRVPDSDFTVLSGETRGFPYPKSGETCAGNGLTRVFCVTCGSRVFTNLLADFPGEVFVQEGTLDELGEWFAPQAEIYTWSRQPWMRCWTYRSTTTGSPRPPTPRSLMPAERGSVVETRTLANGSPSCTTRRIARGASVGRARCAATGPAPTSSTVSSRTSRRCPW